MTAQELFAKAALVDHERLASLQSKCALVDAEETLRGAFWFRCERSRARMAQVKESAARSDAGIPQQRVYREGEAAERSHRNAGASASYA